MLGLIMDRPMLISSLIDFAAEYHGGTEIVTHNVEGGLHRYSYTDAQAESKRLANALAELGIGFGDTVGTLAWNTRRHFEIYYAVSGIGAICHTINPRLYVEQLAYIVNHASDRVLFVEPGFVPLLESFAAEITDTVQTVVVLCDEASLPESEHFNLLSYDTLVAAQDPVFSWPSFDERTASSLCYTSGTTGNPKGVLYSHRGNILHSYASIAPDCMNLSARATVMPVVPMFHANAWGIPYAATMAGSKLVLPGPHLDGENLQALITGERVTMTAAVPTIWLMLLDYLKRSGKDVRPLADVVIGGSAVPRSMIEIFKRDYSAIVRHAWGMTEMSPLGTVNTPLAKHDGMDEEAWLDLSEKQGRPIFGVDMRIVDDSGEELPRDGVAFGDLQVRGYWIASAYHRQDESDAHTNDGWFSTGDVATLDGDGYMRITDRTKDVIKSGGEWISSIDLENAAMGHPDVKQAAVIGVFHPKWEERPLMVVVPRDGRAPDKETINGYLAGKVAKWWLPDDVVLVDELPLTATGKVQKSRLREMFQDYRLPDA
jgi:fatty-acyl-CoA synthase